MSVQGHQWRLPAFIRDVDHQRNLPGFLHDDVAQGFLHSHSYTGNALACSAALATLDIFEEEQVLQRNTAKTAYINNKMLALTDLPIGYLRNTGMIWAFDMEAGSRRFQYEFYQAALQRGLLLRPIGNTIYFMPPYVIDESQMDWMVEQTRQVLVEIIG